MKKISRYAVDNSILITLIILSIISITTIYSAQQLLPGYMNTLFIKQTIWFIIGFALAYGIMYIGNDFINRHIWLFYGIGILLLIALLLWAPTINGAKSWFVIPGFGNFQPSEFMKIILIITLASVIDEFNNEYNDPTIIDELKLLIKVAIITGIPTILTFLQPDTGIVVIYLIITIVMLFISGIRYGWFILLFSIILVISGIIFGIYYLDQDLFVNIFGTNLFYRLDRILDWSSGTGMQLENAITAIGSSGLVGHGFNKTPIYFPEPHTDFIFAVFASNYGLLGAILLIALILFFNFKLINLTNRNISNINKYIIAGIVSTLIYQQVQNIGMTIGLLPITGITLPFISYGGSSILSYMIMIGIIFNVSNQSLRYTN
jgi:rod shape determining protein RodA